MNILNQPWNVVYFFGFVAYLSIRSVYARRTKVEVKIHRQIDWLEKSLLLLVIPSSLLLPLLLSVYTVTRIRGLSSSGICSMDWNSHHARCTLAVLALSRRSRSELVGQLGGPQGPPINN